jgi:hypothetical protein
MEGKMNEAQQQFVGELTGVVSRLATQLGITVDVDVKPYGMRLVFERDEDDARKEFDAYSYKFGYPKSAFGKTFSQQGVVYKIVGVKPTAEKNCFRIERCIDKKEFVCGKGFVGTALLQTWAQAEKTGETV